MSLGLEAWYKKLALGWYSYEWNAAVVNVRIALASLRSLYYCTASMMGALAQRGDNAE